MPAAGGGVEAAAVRQATRPAGPAALSEFCPPPSGTLDAMEVQWDERNLVHLARLGLGPSDVEEVLCSPASARRRLTGGRRAYRGRTAAGRRLAIIADVLGPDHVRPRTAREVPDADQQLPDGRAARDDDGRRAGRLGRGPGDRAVDGEPGLPGGAGGTRGGRGA